MNKIGRVEKINFDELGVFDILAKIDTGAFGNSLHVDDINIENENLTFMINNKQFTYSDFGTVEVKNSSIPSNKSVSIDVKI